MRYGLAGAGMMGKEHLRNIALLRDAAVTAIFEPDAAERASASALAPTARLHESFPALLADSNIDALVIASPNHLHIGQLEDALDARPLPILVEKPLFTHAADQARIEALALRAPLVWVAMEYRYMPAIETFVAQAPAATGGIKMLTIREHRFPFLEKVGHWNRFNRFTGGTLVEKCCHFFDLMRLVIGAAPVRILASASQAVNHLDERIDGEAPDIWDNAYVIVDFAGGARAMLELCMFADGSRFQEELTAVGPDGKIEARVPGPTRFWPDHLGAAPVAEVITSPRHHQGPRSIKLPVDETLLDAGDHNGATYYQHRRFVQAVRRGGVPEVTLHDGMMAVLMGLAAQQAAATGGPVPFSIPSRAFQPA